MTWAVPVLVALAGCSAAPAPAPAPPAPAVTVTGPSLYDLHVALTDQHGDTSDLDVFRGHPVLVSMFYTTCPSACPMLVERLRDVETRLPPAARDDLRVLLVSLDPEHDDLAALGAAATRLGVDPTRWRLARASDDDARSVAGVLGIQYRASPDGEIAHTSVVVLLDADGRQVLRLEGATDPAPLVASIEALTRDPGVR